MHKLQSLFFFNLFKAPITSLFSLNGEVVGKLTKISNDIFFFLRKFKAYFHERYSGELSVARNFGLKIISTFFF